MESESSKREPARETIDAAVDICVEFLACFQANLSLGTDVSSNSAVDDPSAADYLSKLSIAALKQIWPEIMEPDKPGPPPNVVEEKSQRYRRRFDLMISIKKTILMLLPTSLSRSLRDNRLLRAVYNRLAFRITKNRSYRPVLPVKEVEQNRFAEMDRGALRAFVTRYFAGRPDELARLEAFADSLNERGTEIVWVSENFPLTWLGTVEVFNKVPVKMAWIGSHCEESPRGYGSAAVSDIAMDFHVTPFPFVLALLALVKKPAFLINTEMYFSWSYDLEKYAVSCLLLASFFEAAKRRRGEGDGKLCALSYDAVKPIAYITGNGNSAEYFFKKLSKLADILVYNSNVPSFHTFLMNAIGEKIESTHLYRLQPISPAKLETKQRRRPYIPGQELHVACISVQLGDFAEPSKDNVAYYLKQFIASPGVRFHYFCDTEQDSIIRLRETAPKELLDHIEFHPIVRDPKALIDQIEQYHLGLTVSDYSTFSYGISAVKNRFYKDALCAYWESTIATSWLVYAAAGLPAVIPRSCLGINQFVPESCILRVTLSELPALTKQIYRVDYQSIMDQAEKNRRVFAYPEVDSVLKKILAPRQPH